MTDEELDDLVIEMNRFPHPEDEPFVVDEALLERRLQMTPAERIATHGKALELIKRVVARCRDKYAIQVWFH
jgi:hypothetical protein